MTQYTNFNELSKEEQILRWKNVLRVLNNLSPHEREKHWWMGNWGRKTDCGTVACAAGHCGLDPWFRERGFKMDFDDEGHQEQLDEDVCVKFFGYRGTWDIFMDTDTRTVEAVIAEVQQHIEFLETSS